MGSTEFGIILVELQDFQPMNPGAENGFIVLDHPIPSFHAEVSSQLPDTVSPLMNILPSSYSNHLGEA